MDYGVEYHYIYLQLNDKFLSTNLSIDFGNKKYDRNFIKIYGY